ncbi:MAG TPA: PBP1A family penicillin-binding protein [bacterium]|nr:PBP1A family penicillin-binding protein [bacterium]
MGKKPQPKNTVKKAATAKKPTTKKKTNKTPRRGGTSCFVILSGIFVVLIVFTITIAAVVVSMVSRYTRELPDLHQVVIPTAKETTKVFSVNGEIIAELYEENREYASWSEIPDSIKLSFIAVEDERFFKHRGVDVEGLGRIIFLFVKTGGKTKHGASTITQQLAKNVYLVKELKMENSLSDKLTRKLKEWILAITLEKKYSKEEILENYLNLIYLGHGAHGIKTAARTYFGKNMSELTIAESAMLAALPKGPSIYTPYTHPERAKRRRDAILQKMEELHFITGQEYEKSIQEPFHLAKLTGPGYQNYKAPYFVTYLLELLQDADGPFKLTANQIYSNGYRIYTTIDMQLQKHAEESIAYGMKLSAERKANIKEAALLALRPQTGSILAMVGGVDYKKSKFNRTWQALRQPGSSFKPFVYITAIRQGYSMESTLLDEEICYDPDEYKIPEEYCPSNYDGKYKGVMDLHTALKLSRNVPAVKVGHLVGAKNIIETAKSMGIKTPLYPSLSLPLGPSVVTIMDMATAYSTMANGGYRVDPVAVERITDSTGRVLYQKKYKTGTKVLADNELARIIPVLEDVLKTGTGRKADIGRPAAGKTGTTNEFRDAWFCGFVPQMTTIVWFGNDENTTMRNLVKGKPIGSGVTGGSIPAPTWGHFMKQAMKDVPVREFNLPKSSPMKAIEIEIPEATGTQDIDLGFIDAERTTQPLQKKGMKPKFYEFDENSSSGAQPRKNTNNVELLEPEVIEPEPETTNYDDLF